MLQWVRAQVPRHLVRSMIAVGQAERTKQSVPEVVEAACAHHVRDRTGLLNKIKRARRIVLGRLVG